MARHGNNNEPVRGRHAAPNTQTRKFSTQEFPAVSGRASHGAQHNTAPAGAPNQYARENYGSGAGAIGMQPVKKAKKGGAGKRVAIVIVAILAALLLAAGGFFLWFTTSLNKALSSAGGLTDEISEQLVSVSLNEPFYALVLGSDSREGSGSSDDEAESGDNERSDVMMLARVDAPKGQVTLVSIPRDTPYTMEDGTVVKINEAYNRGGAAATIKAVSELTGVGISHYAAVHVSDLQSIVDMVGGVEVYVDRQLSVEDTLTGEELVLEPGQQVLNGRQAQVFVRARHEYSNPGEDQDVSRQGNVRTFVTALAKTILAKPITEIPGTIINIAQYVQTDLNANDLIALAMSFVGKDMNVYSCTGPTEGGEQIINGEYMWFCYPNPEGWAELMRQVDAGLEPGEIDYAATQVVM